MVEVSATSCVICGAPLDPPEGGGIVTCSYCGNKLTVTSGQPTQASSDAPTVGLPVELLQGYAGGDVGEGRRFGPEEMTAKNWKCLEHGVWPVGALASSQFGLGWNADAVVGAPSVYPSCGDRRGAWAPGSRTSRVEWIEASYDPGAGAVETIRVFETCVPGATFAVTVRGEGEEQIVYKGAPMNLGNTAQVLEIPLDPPRKLRAVRAYVSNELGSQWSEIDTIGLVATEPVPVTMRRKPKKAVSGCLIAGIIALVLAVLFVLYFVVDSASCCGGAAPLDTPTARVDGASMMSWNATIETMTEAHTVWAYGEARASSEYGRSDWSAAQATGAPNVYPKHQDDTHAWASNKADAGIEWIVVQFPGSTTASAIVVVETYHPGALVRIDDLSDPAAPVVLWEGSNSAIESSRVLSLELPEPRKISSIRLVADTSRVGGWYAVDAVGLVPAP